MLVACINLTACIVFFHICIHMVASLRHRMIIAVALLVGGAAVSRRRLLGVAATSHLHRRGTAAASLDLRRFVFTVDFSTTTSTTTTTLLYA